jgi:hypothetical protein
MMATTRRNSPLMGDAPYWIGVIMGVACVFFVVAQNTTLVWSLDRASVPLSWVFGGLAIFAFVVYEHLGEGFEDPSESEVAPEELPSTLAVPAALD